MSFLKQKIDGLKKRCRAYTYGITYLRSGDFDIPAWLKVNGKKRQFLFSDSSSDAFIYEFSEICINDCYRLKTLEGMLGAVGTIVDIGANQGLFLLAARQCFKNALISCYEPNPALEASLGHNARMLKASVYYEAATKEDCAMQLRFGSSDLHTVATASVEGDIKGTAFRKIIERAGGKIDILKLDCEGGEWELLDDQAAWHNIRSITMEYHLWAKAGSTEENIFDKLKQLGFAIISRDRLSDQFGLITAVKKN